MTGEPPVDAGADQAIVACPAAGNRATLGLSGALGTVRGTTASEAADTGELPTAFVATAVKV